MERLDVLDEFESESTLRLASIGERFGAFFLDIIILIILQLLIIVPIYGWEVLDSVDPDTEMMTNLISIALSILYFGLQEGDNGATIGKRALGIKVVQENGEPMNPSKGFLRAFGRMLSGIIIFIGYIMAFFNKKKKTLHDNVASTLVVKA